MNPRTIFNQKMADAAMEAIERHWKAGIGTRPVSAWDRRDVINSHLILDSLVNYGLDPSESNEAYLEELVSPIVFFNWHSRVGDNQNRLQNALAMLHIGGVCTYGLARKQRMYAQPPVQKERKPTLAMRFRHFMTFSRI